jgi:2-amino-4-hydroxy-6-hydroxymethyldihydropteridine diphosphokinase
MNQVYLLIGGNLGDRFELLKRAREGIEKQIGELVKESSIYETAAWGFESENDFLNQVLLVKTDLKPEQVLEQCHLIENLLGRVRQSGYYASRTMDMDILFYNDEIINEPDLTIPHPHLHKRKFTLEPLNEISPEYTHPKLKKTIAKLLLDCDDHSDVKRLADLR